MVLCHFTVTQVITKMLMALNRHILHNSLLKVQQHIVPSGNTLKVVASVAVNKNDAQISAVRKSSSSRKQSFSSSDSDGDDTLKNNPYYTAYAEKLRALKSKDTGAYRKALKCLQRENQKMDNYTETTVETTSAVISNEMQSTVTKTEAKSQHRPSQSLLVKPKMLEQVMNTDLLREKSWRDVTEIWLAYHRTRDETLSAVIPLKQFNTFHLQSLNYPMFILPLPRNSSCYEFMFAQFQHYQEHSSSNFTVHITPLISYQTHKENSPECMTVEYYTDLCNTVNEDSSDESYVLMRAIYDRKLLSAVEAACLVNQLRIFYGVNSDNTEKENLLKLFNDGDDAFKHSDVIALVETLSIS